MKIYGPKHGFMSWPIRILFNQRSSLWLASTLNNVSNLSSTKKWGTETDGLQWLTVSQRTLNRYEFSGILLHSTNKPTILVSNTWIWSWQPCDFSMLCFPVQRLTWLSNCKRVWKWKQTVLAAVAKESPPVTRLWHQNLSPKRISLVLCAVTSSRTLLSSHAVTVCVKPVCSSSGKPKYPGNVQSAGEGHQWIILQ